MYKYGFVILHYLTDNDTMECINSIYKNYKNINEYAVVIVDNFSNNKSVERIEEKTKKYSNIFIIKNKKNLGFAKGNNIGYKYCKEKLKCDNIIILNNDILMETSNIFTRIKNDIKEYNAYIIGPDIVSMVDNCHQNPMIDPKYSNKKIKKEIVKYTILRIINWMNIYDVLLKFNNRKKTHSISVKQIDYNNVKLDCLLHGAFLIFTSKFVKYNEIAFNPDTFLYMEELILKKYCENNKYQMLYDPNIKVYHKEDSSTNYLTKGNDKRKREFLFKNLIKSLNVLKKQFYK